MIDFELFFEYYRGASLLCANSFGFRWHFIHFRIVLNGFCSLNPLAPVSPTNKHVVPNTSACILNILSASLFLCQPKMPTKHLRTQQISRRRRPIQEMTYRHLQDIACYLGMLMFSLPWQLKQQRVRQTERKKVLSLKVVSSRWTGTADKLLPLRCWMMKVVVLLVRGGE